MKEIKNNRDYEKAIRQIDELMVKIGDNHSFDNPEFVMMDRLSDMVADYEDKHYSIQKPALIDVIKLRMFEMGLKQSQLAELLEIPKARVSEYLQGKRDITLAVAKKLHQRMNIDGDIILQ